MAASLSASTGHASLPSPSSARRRTSPIVVSSVAPTNPSGMPASCSATIRSPPSSIAACGFDFAAASMPGPGSWPRRASTPSASATSSWVESGFDAASSTSAPPGLERADEVRRLGRDVQTRGDLQPVERLLLREPLADRTDDRHLAGRPVDAGFAWEARSAGYRGWMPISHQSAGRDARGANTGSALPCRGPRPARRCMRPAPARARVSLTPSASRCSRATFSSRCFGST